jgi:hypothetical protein
MSFPVISLMILAALPLSSYDGFARAYSGPGPDTLAQLRRHREQRHLNASDSYPHHCYFHR